ncbi:cold shock and DUF1294 domain-containing protein [Paraglaciecola sp. 25GB23A]|uniref:cold shock and DUF1294 domain-containing protein n=1 Tax=Paraglaciecola sp. 25GB23A TaxID=3156068 RepID=UPI0032AFE3BC
MKFQGKVINWNDEKGFGFVEPNGGGERAFVHIKAFRPGSRRPVSGELITYELVRENNNRYKAEKIKFTADTKALKNRNKTKNNSAFGLIFTLIFCMGLVVSFLFGTLSFEVVVIYFVMSLITFIAYAMDKSAAEKGRWRTKESTLHLFSLICGWPGAYFGQTKFRHKSSKLEFKNVYWVTVFLNIGGLVWLHKDKATLLLDTAVVQFLLGLVG